MRWTVLLPLTLTGCLLGDAWPDLYAEAYCQTAYACVGKDNVEAAAGYVDEANGRDLTKAAVEADPKYNGYLDGDCKWDAKNARSCIDELAEMRESSSCDGEMPMALFVVDALTPACAAVYDECL